MGSKPSAAELLKGLLDRKLPSEQLEALCFGGLDRWVELMGGEEELRPRILEITDAAVRENVETLGVIERRVSREAQQCVSNLLDKLLQ